MLLKPYILLACSQLIGLASALTSHLHQQPLIKQDGSIVSGLTVAAYNFSMPIDHFNASDERFFNNRYWVNDTYYKPGGPVFYYDFGESGVTDQAIAQYLAQVNTTSAVMMLAEQYHGVAVSLELRYFGCSWPVAKNWTTGVPVDGQAGYKYHTTEQGLEDVVYFAKNWKPDGCSGEACGRFRPSKTPWIWIGGSYPGARGAFSRIRNPDVWYAVWASSAVVGARYDGSPWFTPAAASLPLNCSKDWTTAVKYVDEIIAGDHGPEQYLELKRLAYATSFLSFNPQNLDQYKLEDADFYDGANIGQSIAALIFAYFQRDGPEYTTDVLCSFLEAYQPGAPPSNDSDPYLSVLTNPGGGTITNQGLTATYNASVALEGLFYATFRFYEWYRTYIQSTTTPIETLDPYADLLSWLYIVNTELGWYQGSNPENVTIVSKYYNYTFIQEQTRLPFPGIPDGWQWPDQPNTTTFLQYGGLNMTPSQVMFTDGSFDSWLGATVMSNMTYIDAPIRHMTARVPTCGEAPNGTDVFGVIYPGKGHISDMAQNSARAYDETSPVFVGVRLFGQALDVWLPCFNSSRCSL